MAGDAESYATFGELFSKVIKELHRFRYDPPPFVPDEDHRSSEEAEEEEKDVDYRKRWQDAPKPALGRSTVRRHVTCIDPDRVGASNPDPGGDYVLSASIAVSRNVGGYRFPIAMDRGERREIERLLAECCAGLGSGEGRGGGGLFGDGEEKAAAVGKNDDADSGGGNGNGNGNGGEGGGGGGGEVGMYVPVLSLTNASHDDLIRRHILFDDPDEYAISSGLGRDWPDGRGAYLNVSSLESAPSVIVWINHVDHVKIVCNCKGGDITGLFTSLSDATERVEAKLNKRGKKFARDDRLGYLTTCPSNVGTALSASIHVKLLRLGRQPGFDGLVKRMKLKAEGQHGTDYDPDDRRYTGIFDVSNLERLGKSEAELIDAVIGGVKTLIDLERKLERGEEVDCDECCR